MNDDKSRVYNSERHPWMVCDGKATRLATYDEVVEVKNVVENVVSTMTNMSSTMIELMECVKLCTNFNDSINKTFENIDNQLMNMKFKLEELQKKIEYVERVCVK